MKTKRRLFSLLLSVAMLFSLCVPPAFAEAGAQAAEQASGDWDKFHWTLDADGTLTITGTGDMPSADNAKWKPYTREIKKVVVGSGVTSIGDGAFYNCTNLMQAELPDSLALLGDNAFNGCTNLALAALPTGVRSVGYSAFYNCTSLALTELPENLTSIGSHAFENCTNIALIKLPDGVTSIGEWTFYGCTNLALTGLPSRVTSIEKYAFRDCIRLALTELPNSLTSIGENAFYKCTGLKLTKLPASLSSIGDCAFYECTGLTDLTFVSETPPTMGGSGVFWWCTNLTLHIPDNDAYTTENNWPLDITGLIEYNTTVQNDGNGTASASPSSSKAGTEINLTAVPKDGYHFKEWQTVSGGVAINGNSFTMPNTNVMVKAIFEKDEEPEPTTYTITVQADENGMASASQTSITAGTEITLTATPNSGYHFKGWQVISGGVTINSDRFTMPAEDVTVKAIFEKDEEPRPTAYTITVQNDGNGTAFASSASAAAGTEITLTATPNSGYHFKGWQVVSGGVTINNNNFTMPAADVTVKAVFEKDEEPKPTTYIITVQADGNGTASASQTSATEGTEISLTATPNSGCHFKEWQVISGGVTINGNSFTMPAADVTVKAVFEKDSGSTSGDSGGSGGGSGSSSGGTVPPVSPQPTPETPPKQNPWQQTRPAAGNDESAWTYIDTNGAPLTGRQWITGENAARNLYLFDAAGLLLTGGQPSAVAPDGSGIRISAAGDVWMNGHRYYLNPERDLNTPQSCYAVTDYNRVLPNNGGISYHDKNGISYRGWLRGADGRMRYQTYIQPDSPNGEGYCLIVWRIQYIPESPDPDCPNDPAHNIPAGWYFFDDYGVRVTAAGWYDGRDGREYYANADGRVTDSRQKG